MKPILIILFSFISYYNAAGQPYHEIIDRNYNMVPQVIGIQDMNADGLNDIVLASGYYSAGDLAWYERKPDGSYLPHFIQYGTMYTNVISIFDADNDGDNDIAIAGNGDDKILIYKQVTSDSFYVQHTEFADSTDLDYDQGVGILGSMDVDADGDTDIVFSGLYNATQKRLGWLENHGDTTKWSYHTILSPVDGFTWMQCKDFNNDGLTDIFLLDILPEFSIYYFKNTGGAFVIEEIPVEGEFVSGSVLTSDMNGDSYEDILLFACDNYTGDYPLEIIYNQSGEFAPLLRDTIDIFPVYTNFFSRDYDVDGDFDIFTNINDDISLLKNNNDGSYEPSILIWDSSECIIRGLACDDLNGDEHPDFLFIDQISPLLTYNVFPVYGVEATDTFLAGENIYNFSWFSLPKLGRFNADSLIDIISSVNIGEMYVYLENDDVSMLNDKLFVNDVNDLECTSILLADAADVNGDSLDDFIAFTTYSSGCDQLVYYCNSGDSTFSKAQVLLEGRLIHFGGDGIINTKLADINFDGFPEVCCISSWTEDEFSPTYYYITIFKNDSGIFSQLPDIYLTSEFIGGLQLADFDNDNDLDICILFDYSENFLLFENTGALNFDEPDVVISADSIRSVIFCNINNDNYPDILINYSPNYFPYVMYNDSGIYGLPELLTSSLHFATAYDLDLDGRDELIGLNENDSLIYIYNNALFGFTGIGHLLPDLSYSKFMDVNNNGKIDILSQYYNKIEMYYDLEVDTTYTPQTGIDLVADKQIEYEVFPNPASDYFIITGINDVDRIKLIDIGGREVLALPSIKDNSVIVDTHEMLPGLYFIMIFTDSGVTGEKVIIN